ncbi:MAG: gamma-glutamyl-gamma-aminobutyrate hydrolase family protein [Anaerolineae bacterium]|nr:gamma-glutamyl-gamma-aminobutyrate hydrolase family protein [Anaerolineae bacterium]
MIRPLIGITTASVNLQGKIYHRAYAPISLATAAAGGLPVLIPCGLDDETLHAIYETLDAVLLPGGPDVDPAHYGQKRHPQLGNIDNSRDALELTLTRWAVDDDLPVFGICRGHQVLNVALGGTLVQDIPSQVETDLPHDIPDNLPRSTRIHDITIDPESRLAEILGGTRFQVNSLHHQSVQDPAPGAAMTAYSPDGIVEALEMPDKSFVLSVQWHPEDLYGDDESMNRLFTAFVQAARERHIAHERANPV